MGKDQTYIPGLNGLRTVAAISVIICHIFFMNIGERFLFEMGIAHYAVTMFFAISGFLITHLLLIEKDQNNSILIKNFYFRRILRIWPIYFAYIILASIILFILGRSETLLSYSFLIFLLLSGNFIIFFQSKGIELFEHFWSIGVEEQFYLFWPWIVRNINKIKKTYWVTIALILLYLSIKLVIYLTIGTESNVYQFVKQTRIDCMLIGALGAMMHYNKNKIFIKLMSNKILQISAWLFYFLLGFNYIHFPVLIAHEAVAIATLILIVGQIYNPLINLEKKLFNFLGKISYGLYVIHPLILHFYAYFFININVNLYLKWGLYFVFSMITTIVISWISFTYFESYFLKLKNKFAIIRNSNRTL